MLNLNLTTSQFFQIKKKHYSKYPFVRGTFETKVMRHILSDIRHNLTNYDQLIKQIGWRQSNDLFFNQMIKLVPSMRTLFLSVKNEKINRVR